MNKKILSQIIITIVIIIGVSLFLINNQRSNKNNKSLNNPSKQANGPMNYKTANFSNDPESESEKEWGVKIKEEEIDEKLQFKLRMLPKSYEKISGKLLTIRVHGAPQNDEKSDAANLFFDSGIKVQQILLPDGTPLIKKLEDYGVDSEEYKEQKKIWKNVDLNGVEGMAYGPLDQETITGGTHRAPGAVSWYSSDNKIGFTLYGNGKIPLEKLLKVARLFNP